jgi:hypothetical protein
MKNESMNNFAHPQRIMSELIFDGVYYVWYFVFMRAHSR